MVPEARHDEHGVLARRDHLDRLVVGVGGVLEHVDTRLDADLDTVVASHVRRDLAVALVGLVDGDCDLLEGVHRLLGRHARTKETLARDVELDHVAAFLDVLADGLADLLHAVGEDREPFHAELPVRGVPVEHPRGGTDVAARGRHARAGDDAFVDQVTDRHVDPVQGAGTGDSRIAAAQRELGVLDGIDRRALDRELQIEILELADAPERDVEMALDQAGHQRLAREVDGAEVAVRALAEVRRTPYPRDLVAFDENGSAVDRRASSPVDQPRVQKQGWSVGYE